MENRSSSQTLLDQERQRVGLMQLVKLNLVPGWVAHFKDGTKIFIDAPADYTFDQVSHLAVMRKDES